MKTNQTQVVRGRAALVAGAVIGSVVLASVMGGSREGWAAPKHMESKGPSWAAVSGVLKANCVSCHNDKEHPEKVNLSTFDKMMASGEHGPIVFAGHPEKSKLLLYVDGEKSPRMPFKRPPLSKGDIAIIRDWIKAGAKR